MEGDSQEPQTSVPSGKDTGTQASMDDLPPDTQCSILLLLSDLGIVSYFLKGKVSHIVLGIGLALKMQISRGG